jgi:hypothetical protein
MHAERARSLINSHLVSSLLTTFLLSRFPLSLAVGPCKVMQSIPIATSDCTTPHEMGVDEITGDVYVACVASANVLRFVRQQ